MVSFLLNEFKKLKNQSKPTPTKVSSPYLARSPAKRHESPPRREPRPISSKGRITELSPQPNWQGGKVSSPSTPTHHHHQSNHHQSTVVHNKVPQLNRSQSTQGGITPHQHHQMDIQQRVQEEVQNQIALLAQHAHHNAHQPISHQHLLQQSSYMPSPRVEQPNDSSSGMLLNASQERERERSREREIDLEKLSSQKSASLAFLREENEFLSHQSENLQKQLLESRQKNSELLTELENQKDENNKLLVRIKISERSMTVAPIISEDAVERLTHKIKEKDQKISSLSEQIEIIKKENDSLNEEIKSFEKRHNFQQERSLISEQEISRLRQRVSDLEINREEISKSHSNQIEKLKENQRIKIQELEAIQRRKDFEGIEEFRIAKHTVAQLRAQIADLEGNKRERER